MDGLNAFFGVVVGDGFAGEFADAAIDEAGAKEALIEEDLGLGDECAVFGLGGELVT